MLPFGLVELSHFDDVLSGATMLFHEPSPFLTKSYPIKIAGSQTLELAGATYVCVNEVLIDVVVTTGSFSVSGVNGTSICRIFESTASFKGVGPVKNPCLF
jgi:hypothetical protein